MVDGSRTGSAAGAGGLRSTIAPSTELGVGLARGGGTSGREEGVSVGTGGAGGDVWAGGTGRGPMRIARADGRPPCLRNSACSRNRSSSMAIDTEMSGYM